MCQTQLDHKLNESPMSQPTRNIFALVVTKRFAEHTNIITNVNRQSADSRHTNQIARHQMFKQDVSQTTLRQKSAHQTLVGKCPHIFPFF